MPATANERRAVAGHKAIPDGTIGALDRRQVAGHYPMAAVAPSGFVVDGGNVILQHEPPARTAVSLTNTDSKTVVLGNEPKERSAILQFTKG